MIFERLQLKIKSLTEGRMTLITISSGHCKGRSPTTNLFGKVARHIVTAKGKGKKIVLMAGGHVVRAGVQNYLIDLMERGYLSCIAMNGSVMIHDFEFALIGATTESVARYIKEGQFGLWKETGQINDIINKGYKDGLGMGEAVGEAIFKGDFPHKNISFSCRVQA